MRRLLLCTVVGVRRVLRWAPLMAALVVAAIPLWQHFQSVRAESWGEAFLVRVLEAQREFQRRTGAGFAATLESLTTPCPGAPAAALEAAEIGRAGNRGFHVALRPAEGARPVAVDCHGQLTTTDFYASLQPASAEAAPRKAYAIIGSAARVFVFFDGLPPGEGDMEPGGLATPLDSVGAFRIP